MAQSFEHLVPLVLTNEELDKQILQMPVPKSCSQWAALNHDQPIETQDLPLIAQTVTCSMCGQTGHLPDVCLHPQFTCLPTHADHDYLSGM
jgi:hypothetical protein